MISRNVKIFTFISLLFIILLVLGGVSAQSVDDTQETTTTDTSISTDSNIMEQSNEISVQKQTDNKNVKEESIPVSTYHDLKTVLDTVEYEEVEVDLEDKIYEIDEPLVLNMTDSTSIDGIEVLTINGNGATFDGSNNFQFITVGEGITLNLNNLIIKNTVAINGSAIKNYGTVNINNVTFIDNNAAKNGGAIYSEGTLNIEGNSHFIGNHVTDGVNGEGGAAIFTKSTIYVKDTEFDSNIGVYTDASASSNGANGGAIFVSNSISDMVIINSTFTNNKGRHGGAILIDDNLGRNQGNKIIKESTFEENQAIYGGAIEVYNDLIIEDSVFNNNKAYGYGSGNINPKGGAICVNDLVTSGEPGSLTVKNTSFTGNTVPQTTVTGSTLLGYGGAIYNSGPDAVIDNCTFTANSANKGGAYYLITNNRTLTRSATFTNSIFRENGEYAPNGATAIHDEHYGGTHESQLTIDNCVFEDNRPTSSSGYAIYAIYDNLTITNSNISDVRPFQVGSSQYAKYVNNVTVNGLENVTGFFNVYPEVHPTDYEQLVIASKRINNYTGTQTVRIHLTGTEYIETEPIIFDRVTATVAMFGNYRTIDANGKQFLTIGEGRTVTLNNITIANAKADNGAAIINHGTLTTQNNVVFDNNEALYYGGAIYSTGTLTVKSTNFTNNKVSTIQRATRNDYGGAAIASLGKLTVEKSNFIENVAAHNDVEPNGDGGCGGAINILNTTQAVSITTSNFTKNSARHGGAILINNNDKTNTNKVTIDKNNFIENTALYGGAIDTYQQVNITNNNFTKNTVSGEGSSGRPSMGGAIVINKGNAPYTAIVENNTFKENEAQEGGRAGVIEVQPDTTLTSKNNVYQDNKAYDTGVVNNLGSATFTSDVFTGNSATYTGVFTQMGDELTVTGCTFENNEADDYGDILYASKDVTITGSTINTDNLEKLIYNENQEITTTQNTVNGELLEEGLIKTTLTINPDVTIVLDENNPVTATLIDATNVPVEGKEVNLVVDGTVVGSNLTDKNGAVSIDYKPTEGTSGTIKFTFTPDDYYIGSESEEIAVQYKIKTKLTITELVPLLGGENSYTVKGELRDANDNLLPGMTIYLEVDGLNVKSGLTGSDEESLGQFAISFTEDDYDPTIGEHTVWVGFLGEDIYNENLTAENKTFIIYGDTQINVEKDVYAIVKDYETAEDQLINIAINDESEEGADLTVSVGEYYVTYIVAPETDTFSISLKELLENLEITETTTVDVEYKPYDESYKASYDTFTIKIKQTPTLNYDVLNDIEAKVAIEFTATDEEGNDIDYLDLTLSGDVTDTARIGRAYRNTELTEGIYTVTLTSAETDEYGPGTLEFTLEVKKDPQTIINELNESLINNQTALENNITALEQLQRENDALKQQIEALEEALAANETALAGNMTALAQAQDEIAQLEQNITTLNEQLEANKTALAQAEADLAAAQAENEALNAQIGELENALENNKTALAEAEAEIERLNTTVTDLETELNATKEELAQSEEENANLTAKVEELEAALTEAEANLTAAQEEIETLNTQISELETELEEKEAALNETQQALDEAQEEIEELNTQISELETELEEKEAALNETQQALDEAQEEIEELEYKISELELALKLAEKALDNVIEALENLNKPKATSISIDPIVDVKYGDEIEITGLLVNEDALSLSNQPVTLTINGEEVELTTRNGEFSYTTTITTVGENTVTVYYAGNDKYEASDASTTFISEKADIIITFDDMEAIKKGETITISGTITDHNDNIMANSVVKLLINNGRKTLRADDEGRFTFDYALSKVGQNNITATFLENDFYNEAVEKVSVEVLPLDSIITINPIDPVAKGETVTITGKLTDENGEVIANAQVRVFVNGSPKTLKTDADGVFTHTYTMGKVGQNNISVTYAGSINYAQSEAAATVEVSKSASVIIINALDNIIKGDNVTISGKVTDMEGNSIAYAQVKITVNGSPKTVKCDADGVFVHNYVMNRLGENDITVFFNGNNNFLATNTTSIVEVVKA